MLMRFFCNSMGFKVIHKSMLAGRLFCFLFGLFALFTSAVNAADLSGGVKGLKVGMTTQQAFAKLKELESAAGGRFVPVCDYMADGYRCFAGVKFTYGNEALGSVHLHFGRYELDEVRFLLSGENCTEEIKLSGVDPRFNTLFKNLTQYLGPPDKSIKSVKVWESKNDLMMINYFGGVPGVSCPSIAIDYSTKQRFMERAKIELNAARARERDF